MYPGYPKAAFSYTESDPTMLWLAASAAWKPVLVSGRAGGSWPPSWDTACSTCPRRRTDTSAGSMRTRTYDRRVWPAGAYLQSGTDLVLTYWVLWNVPTAGLSVTLTPAARRLRARRRRAWPCRIVADQDDHVLRYKLSTASGLGFGGTRSWRCGTPGEDLSPGCARSSRLSVGCHGPEGEYPADPGVLLRGHRACRPDTTWTGHRPPDLHQATRRDAGLRRRVLNLFSQVP